MRTHDTAALAATFLIALSTLVSPASGQEPPDRTWQQQVRVQPREFQMLSPNQCAERCESERTHPALYFRTRKLRIPPSSCLATARDTVTRLGLANADHGAFGSGGTRGTARAFITCVTLPDAGPCGGNGASVVFAVASNKDAAEANTLLAQLDERFGNPILFDCNG